jgi:hypothetical protein
MSDELMIGRQRTSVGDPVFGVDLTAAWVSASAAVDT